MKRKKRYTKKQLLRWYKEEIKEILTEKLKTYKYVTKIVVPMKLQDFFMSNDYFLTLCQYAEVIRPLLDNEIGQMFNNKIVITKSKKKEVLIKFDKLVKK